MSEKIIFGIASVFVNPNYRRRGYGTRLMHKLARVLPEMHVGSSRPIGSIFNSEIGKDSYTKVVWPAGLSCEPLH